MPSKARRTVTEIHPAILGVVFTMVKIYGGGPTSTNQEFITRVRRELNVPTFKTTIRSNQRLYTDATSNGVPLAVATNVHDDIARELDELADEFITKLDMEGRGQ